MKTFPKEQTASLFFFFFFLGGGGGGGSAGENRFVRSGVGGEGGGLQGVLYY